MEDKYFVLVQSDNGFHVDGPMSKKVLLKGIDEQYWGNLTISSEMPQFYDGNFNRNCIVVIKGEIVIPRPVTTITKYDI